MLGWTVRLLLFSRVLIPGVTGELRAQRTTTPKVIETAILNVPTKLSADDQRDLALRTPRLQAPEDQQKCFQASDPLENLATLFHDAKWQELQRETDCILTVKDGFKVKIEPDKNYYLIVFAANGRRIDPQVIRYVFHQDKPEQYGNQEISSLPGITDSLFEIFLTEQGPINLYSKYTYTKVDNPLASQASDFIKPILETFTPVLGLTNAFSLKADATKTKPLDIVAVTARLSSVPVLYNRATLEISDVITVGDTRPLAKVQADAKQTRAEIVLREARLSTCAQQLNNAIATAIQNVTCTEIPRFGRTCWDVLDTKVSDGFKVASVSPECTTMSQGDLQAFLTVEAKYRTLVTPKDAKEITGTSTLSNTPLTRYTFGLLTSFIVTSRGSRDRAKVDSGNVVRDPLIGNLTMGMVNIHFMPYDSSADSMTVAERVRWFAGGVLTPNFGFGTGPGVAILRNLTVNAGIAWLVIPKPSSEQGLDKPAGSAPLKNGVGRAVFVGMGYSFK